jgi:lipopolysaccharide export system permease protein
MRIIDRYVLRQFLQAFVICYISLTGLFVVFDAFANLDEFMRYSERHGNLLLVMGEFYSYRAVFFFDRICGIISLIAAMFTVTWIRRHNELTALMAAGISGVRVAMPVMAAAVSIAILAAVSREIVIPQMREQLSRDPKDLLGEMAKPLQPRYDHQSDILIRGKSTLAKDQSISDPSFVLPPTLAQLGKQLAAQDAYWKVADADHPSGYLLEELRPESVLDELPSAKLDDRVVVYTPKDCAWLKPREAFVVSNVSFEQLTGGRGFRVFSSTWNLIQALKNPSLDFGADVRVTIHMRMVQPLLDVTLLFLGLPLVLTREIRNVFLAIFRCILLVAVFLGVVLGCQFLGSSYWIHPALAAWCPLILFVPAAVALSDSLEI